MISCAKYTFLPLDRDSAKSGSSALPPPDASAAAAVYIVS